jgi:hypothetical protein
VGTFDQDYTNGQITPVLKPGLLPRISVPTFLVNFMMTLVSPDEWSRDSKVLGQRHHYRFRRVIDANGQRLPAWYEYVKYIETNGPKNSLIPICTLNNGSGFPTACSGKRRR